MTTVRTSTFDLKLLKAEPNKYLFPWGEIKTIHEIGPYNVLEVIDRFGHTQYHSYVNNEAAEGHSETLDEALILCLAHRLGGASRTTRAQAAAMLLKFPGFDK